MKVVLWMLIASALQAQAISDWAFGGPDHRLHYKTDSRGNSIMDFSAAGYRAGGVRLPDVVTSQRLTPSPGDNTARIQAALDKTTGAVVLASGQYEISGTLNITRSNVVLRGEKGVIVRLTGKPHRFLEIHGAGTWREVGSRAPIVDAYVPAGAASFRVQGAGDFHAGDRVLVLHPVTVEWIHLMGMDAASPSGKAQPSIDAATVIRTDRTVDSVDGDRITLDVPLSDALDAKLTSASLVHYSFSGRIAEVGVEGLRIEAQFEDAPIGEPQYGALRMDAVEDGWARDLDIRETWNGIEIGPGAKRLTLTNVRVQRSKPPAGAAEPADFALQGTQILLDRCSVTGEGTWPVVTQADVTGPLVVLNFVADRGGISPRQPWATGLLVDRGKFPGGTERQPAIAFSSSEIGWSVAWNVSSPFLLVQQPPGVMNWCIGCIGTPVTVSGGAKGIFDSLGKMVEPASLYLQQLRDRLGPGAVRAIGY